MKFLFDITFVFIFMLLSSCGGGDDSGGSNESTNSRINSYISTKLTSSSPTLYIITYDSLGRIFQLKKDYSNNDTINYIATYFYDVNGFKLEVRFDFEGDGQDDTIERYTVDDNGKIISTEIYDHPSGIMKGTGRYYYDDTGKYSRYEEFHSDDSLYFTQEFQYDKNNFITKSIMTSGTTETIRVYSNNLSNDGRLVSRSTDVGGDGAIDYETEYTYEGGLCVDVEPKPYLSFLCNN